jgi:uncharacterized damage-inducible protein DinB
MALSESMLPEFDREMALTRKCLERVPDERLEWRPHPKSMSLAQLAGFLAILPSWTAVTIAQDSLDVEPPGGPQAPPLPTSTKQILEMFDVNVGSARGSLQAAEDGRLLAPWTLLKAGQKLLTMPRVTVLRAFVLNHLVHHRGQLTVYLRLCEAPVPSLYGPTADDPSWS